MGFSNQEKEAIRYHLGYPNIGEATGLTAGVPQARQFLFLVEDAMNRVLPEAEARVRTIVGSLTNIEQQLIDGQCYLKGESVGDIKVRQDHLDRLEQEYARWSSRLADILCVPKYAFSARSKVSASRGVRTVPLRR